MQSTRHHRRTHVAFISREPTGKLWEALKTKEKFSQYHAHACDTETDRMAVLTNDVAMNPFLSSYFFQVVLVTFAISNIEDFMGSMGVSLCWVELAAG
jgi:hypothetical protein